MNPRRKPMVPAQPLSTAAQTAGKGVAVSGPEVVVKKPSKRVSPAQGGRS